MKIKCDNTRSGWAGPLTTGDHWEIIKSKETGSDLAWLRRGPRDGEKWMGSPRIA